MQGEPSENGILISRYVHRARVAVCCDEDRLVIGVEISNVIVACMSKGGQFRSGIRSVRTSF